MSVIEKIDYKDVEYAQKVADLTNDEYGDYITAMIHLYENTTCMPDSLYKAFITEFGGLLNYIKENTKIEETTETRTYTEYYVEWKDD